MIPIYKKNNSIFNNLSFLEFFKDAPQSLSFFLGSGNGGKVYYDIHNKDYLSVEEIYFTKNYSREQCIRYFLEWKGSDNFDFDNFSYIYKTLYQDWFYSDGEVEFAKKLIPFSSDSVNYYCIDTNRNNEIRYFDMSYSYHENIKEYEVLAPSFTSFIKLLIDQNGGYIKNLSEIYEKLVKQGFR